MCTTAPHIAYMKRCLELAENGLGHVAPNPMVGAVVVHNNTIIGEGWHKQYGQAHAEVNAINSVTNKELLKESTLYVSLEPCCHFGKTPPCTQLIIKHKIPRVVIAITDPFSKVSGEGIIQLQEAGIEVTVGVLAQQAEWLNRRFITFHRQHRPYVILKWAQSADGFIDKVRTPGQPFPWLTNSACKTLVHKWRAEESSILAGTNTVVNDNPLLTLRHWAGNNPLRITIDRRLRLPIESHIFNNETTTLLFTDKSKLPEATKRFANKQSVKILAFDSAENQEQELLEKLYKLNIQSIIIEGGRQLVSNFIRKGLWDEALVFTGNQYLEEGIGAPKLTQARQQYSTFIDGVNLRQFIRKNS